VFNDAEVKQCPSDKKQKRKTPLGEEMKIEQKSVTGCG
jgi:hypothetical protein